MTDLVIYGIGPFAELMHYYFTNDSDYRVAAFTADAEYIQRTAFCGLPVVPFEEISERYPPRTARMFVAIGYRRMRARQVLFSRAKERGYVLASYISSRALRFSNLKIGENNVAMGNVHMEPFVKIGDNNLFWSDTLVCHHVSVGHGNYIAAKCVLGGNSEIEDGSFLGNGTVLINGVKIDRETHVLPGSAVYHSTKAFHKYLGNPARPIGEHREQGIVIERG